MDIYVSLSGVLLYLTSLEKYTIKVIQKLTELENDDKNIQWGDLVFSKLPNPIEPKRPHF